MGDYITSVNKLIAAEVARIPNVVLYGENINQGSQILGLTRDLRVQDGGRIINVGNCEYTHCGVGFGLMMAGVSCVLFVKQLDFMLLGMDHFVSTYNFVRCSRDLSSLGSFTIITIVCDQGYQGPQSSFNALSDICSLSRVPGYTVTNNQDTAHVLRRQLGAAGFRFIVLSQKLFPHEFLQLDVIYAAEDCSVYQYTSGEAFTIVALNFSLPEALCLQRKLLARGLSADLFSANYSWPPNWERIRGSVARTRTIVVLDDSKGANSLGYMLLDYVTQGCGPCERLILTQEDIDFGVSPDSFRIDYESVISQLFRSDAVSNLVRS
jgi:pyruvate/2-oxoglutarate/acetoin dehydrogenase E1 component